MPTQLDDIVGMAFGGRYVLLLNGLFAVYVGFIYNEAFSVPLGLWPSTWHVPKHAPPDASAVWDGTVYPFGVDPMWHKAQNKVCYRQLSPQKRPQTRPQDAQRLHALVGSDVIL